MYLGIKINYASVTHPQSNRQVEKANGLVCGSIKKRLLAPLEQAAGNWVEELPIVLWKLAHHPEHLNPVHTLFHAIWGRGGAAARTKIWSSPNLGIRRRRGRISTTG